MSRLNREQSRALVADIAFTRICDDATYPQIYTELLARHNYDQFKKELVYDVMAYDLSSDLLTELEQTGIPSRKIARIIEQEADKVIAEWEQMSIEDQKEICDVEELDQIRALHAPGSYYVVYETFDDGTKFDLYSCGDRFTVDVWIENHRDCTPALIAGRSRLVVENIGR